MILITYDRDLHEILRTAAVSLYGNEHLENLSGDEDDEEDGYQRAEAVQPSRIGPVIAEPFSGRSAIFFRCDECRRNGGLAAEFEENEGRDGDDEEKVEDEVGVEQRPDALPFEPEERREHGVFEEGAVFLGGRR